MKLVKGFDTPGKFEQNFQEISAISVQGLAFFLYLHIEGNGGRLDIRKIF